MQPITEVEVKHRLLNKVDEETYLNIQDLTANHGLLTTAPWQYCLGKISQERRQYISTCLRRGETLEGTPRITISTIHKAKGAQSNNVLMTTDIPTRPDLLWRQEDFDDEARVFYVGLTRAKRELHLIHPMRSAGYNIPHGDACSAGV
jgi:superfamily I DNA/RNA helicase